jgi:molybdopterin converting factor small subunit
MKIKIRAFGPLSDIIGNETMEVTPPVRLEKLEASLKSRSPELAANVFMVFVNGILQPPSTLIKDQDEVAFIPPFAGG